ncbi:MAG: DUF2242 domain-containing protein [Pseudomonadota bacterium]|nr:DUF2242 domain-containing protein [Pseudomonadota bacterium]
MALAVLPVGLTACVGLSSAPAPLVNYQPEAFDASSHVRHFAVPPQRTCEAARRALLSQAYVITNDQPALVIGRKYFQPHPERHVQLEFRVVCVPSGAGGSASSAFVSGLQDQYVVRKAKESASLGVGGLGSLSLPIEGGMESMVKVGSETVTHDALYERFFELLRVQLDKVVRLPAHASPAAALPAEPAPEPAHASPSTLPPSAGDTLVPSAPLHRQNALPRVLRSPEAQAAAPAY